MKPAAKPAWDRLTEAMQNIEPHCAGDERYIADLLENGDQRIMGQICGACPLLFHCTDYALTDKPKGGWWPGLNITATARKDQAA